MRATLLAAAALLLTACPDGAPPMTGLDLSAEVDAWVRKADANWADSAGADVTRLRGLTAQKILDLIPSRAEGICRILAHLDIPEVRTLFLELLDHPDSRSGFFRGFILDGAVVSFARAQLAGQIPDTKPLETRIRTHLQEIAEYHWFGPNADAAEALSATALLPDLLAAAKRVGETAGDARIVLVRRTIRAHYVLRDPGAIELAREVAKKGPSFAMAEAIDYLHEHLPKEFPLRVPEYARGWNDVPGGGAPTHLAEDPKAVRFVVRNGRGNQPVFLLRFIQPPMSKTSPRWHAEERNILQQRAELQRLFAIPLPSLMNDLGEPNPYETWDERIGEWWNAQGHELVWRPVERRYGL